MKIWKWELELVDQQYILVPVGARLLDVQMQNGVCCIWALCDPEALRGQRSIAIYGTGHLIPDEPMEYIATFQMHGGALVFHAFEVAHAETPNVEIT